jgi:M6 family metalloprotease-like protein
MAMRSGWVVAVCCAAAAWAGWAEDVHKKGELDGFRTVTTAVMTSIKPQSTKAAVSSGGVGYLGIVVSADTNGNLVIQSVDGASPAATAGLRDGDVVTRVGNVPVSRVEALEDRLHALTPGEAVTIVVQRDGKPVQVAAVVGSTSRPLKLSPQRAVMGVQMKDSPEGNGAMIDRVTQNTPAARAGLQPGDVIVEMDGIAVSARDTFTDLLSTRAPEETIVLKFTRQGKSEEAKVKLMADPAGEQAVRGRGFNQPPQGGGAAGGSRYWKKNVLRLAIIGIEFADVKHNPKINPKDWEDSIFSRGTYTNTNPTGQPVYGSVNDSYLEQSCGAFHLEGKAFAYVAVSKNRSEYGQSTTGPQKTAVMNEALAKLFERDGKDALKGYDGLCFIYAGDRPQVNRGHVYWPHKGNMVDNGYRWSYYICPEGGSKMTNISVFTHEFGHMLGLPDLYARPENPGSEGLGVWSLMSNQNGNGRPQHMDPWCKEQLGWLRPAVIDPSVKQKLVLSPIEGSNTECFKVLVRPDGSEYFLLENRRKTGWDKDLPGEGLLIWRVVGGHVVLEEAHGVEGPSGPRSFLREVPFPSIANRSFTPFTAPSSRSLMGGGAEVWITNIERREDGRVTFSIGYEYF